MEIVENGNCGKWKWWELFSVEDENCEKMEIVENENCGNGNCGKWKLWKMEIVENGNCGK